MINGLNRLAATECRCGLIRRTIRDGDQELAEIQMPWALRRLLGRYDWRGNVRELKMFIERLAVTADGHVIDFTAVLLALPGVDSRYDPTYLTSLLAATGWDITKAARALGIHRSTLHRRMKELAIVRPGRPRVSHATLPVSRATGPGPGTSSQPPGS